MLNRPQLLAVDNLDDRREVWEMLARLHPADRWLFVAAICKGCRVGNKSPSFRTIAGDRERLAEARIGVGKADDGITGQCYGFLWSLASDYGLDLDGVLARLVEFVRGKATLADVAQWSIRQGRKHLEGES